MKIIFILGLFILSCSTTSISSTDKLVEIIDRLFLKNAKLGEYLEKFEPNYIAPPIEESSSLIIGIKNKECPQIILDKNENQEITSVILSCELGVGTSLPQLTSLMISNWQQKPYMGKMKKSKLNIKRFYLVSPDGKKSIQLEDFQNKVKLISWSL